MNGTKRRIALGLCLALLTVPGLAGAEEAVVNTPEPAARLGLFARPDLKAEIRGWYYNGTPVTVVRSADEGWAVVEIAGVEGYVTATDLAYGDVAKSVQPGAPRIAPRADEWSLYEAARADAPRIARLPAEDAVEVLGIVDEWYHVRYPGGVGYVRMDDVTLPTPAEATDAGYGPGVYPIGEGITPGYYVVQGADARISVRLPDGEAPLRCALADVEGADARSGYAVLLEAGAEVEVTGSTHIHRIVGERVLSERTCGAFVGTAALAVGEQCPAGAALVRAAPGRESGTYALRGEEGNVIAEGSMAGGETQSLTLEEGMTLTLQDCTLQVSG